MSSVPWATRVAVLEQVNLRGGGRDAFAKDGLAGKGVDERALAGVELADHDEQEELVELPDGRRPAPPGPSALAPNRVSASRSSASSCRPLFS